MFVFRITGRVVVEALPHMHLKDTKDIARDDRVDLRVSVAGNSNQYSFSRTSTNIFTFVFSR
jgi:hypothetical protein